MPKFYSTGLTSDRKQVWIWVRPGSEGSHDVVSTDFQRPAIRSRAAFDAIVWNSHTGIMAESCHKAWGSDALNAVPAFRLPPGMPFGVETPE